MNSNGLEYIVSTHENGKPSGRVLIDTFWFFLTTAVLFYMSYFLITSEIVQNVESIFYVSILLVLLAVITFIFGILNLRPITIIVNDHGIQIKKGGKIREASWSEILEIKSLEVIGFFGSGRAYSRAGISFKTKQWKYTISLKKFNQHQFKELFKISADYANRTNITVIDNLKWLC